MPVDLNELNGPQRKIVRDAFLAAFDKDSLTRLLSDDLDKRLDTLVPPGEAFLTIVFQLIGLAQREAWLDQLVNAAERSSKNSRIAKLRHTLETTQIINLPAVENAVNARAAATAGGLERMVRQVGFADWGLWVERMTGIGGQICRIEYPVGVKMGGGTGVLVAPDLILTNYHVIKDHQKGILSPTDITCRFDFRVGAGTPVPVKLAAVWLVDFSTYSPHDPGDNGGLPDPDHLDYALLRLERPIGEDVVNGAKRGHFTLKADTAVPAPGDILLIGQHPTLEPLKLAIGTVIDQNSNGTRLRYDANTEKGSSGSPCFDVGLNVVALHHGGDPDYTNLLGKYNQGIPIAMILKRMEGRVAKFWS